MAKKIVRHHWTDTDKNRLIELYRTKSITEIVAELNIEEGPIRNKIYELRKAGRIDYNKIKKNKSLLKSTHKKVQYNAGTEELSVTVTKDLISSIDAYGAYSRGGKTRDEVITDALSDFFRRRKNEMIQARKFIAAKNKK